MGHPFSISKDDLLTYLKEHAYVLGVLATVDEAGRPYTSNVFFGWDEEAHFYFASKEQRAHSRHIADNPNVAVSFINSHRYGVTSPDKVGVQLQGVCTPLAAAEARDAFVHYAANVAGARDAIDEEEFGDPDGHTLYKITPHFIKVWDEHAFAYDGAIVTL